MDITRFEFLIISDEKRYFFLKLVYFQAFYFWNINNWKLLCLSPININGKPGTKFIKVQDCWKVINVLDNYKKTKVNDTKSC